MIWVLSNKVNLKLFLKMTDMNKFYIYIYIYISFYLIKRKVFYINDIKINSIKEKNIVLKRNINPLFDSKTFGAGLRK